MEMDILFSILKWIGLVFAAGFIGYFGKYLGKIIVKKFGKEVVPSPTVKSTTAEPGAPENKIKDKQAFKLEKKRLKSAEKKQKKDSKS